MKESVGVGGGRKEIRKGAKTKRPASRSSSSFP